MTALSGRRTSLGAAIGRYGAAILTHAREAGPLRVALRALVIWAIDTVALLLLIRLLGGLSVDRWQTAIVAALVIGLLNATVRPTVLLLAANLSLVVFTLVLFFLNAVVIWLAGSVVSGFHVASLWSALAASFGLAALSTIFASLLHIGDDDSFYRNVTRRLQNQAAPTGDLDRLGTVIVQIDGLALPVLQLALAQQRMPTLQRWLARGSHRLIGWECDVPSMTSSGQAGILWGNNANIPAFRWYDKELGRLLVSNHPADARLINERQATDGGLLRAEGSSIGNIFTGGSERNIMTMATLVNEQGKFVAAPRDFIGFFVSPYNLTRLVMALVWEVCREYWQAWQQRRRDVQPCMHRGGRFPLQRAGTNVLLRDLTTWLVVSDMQSGRLVTYSDFLGYDEVAHHAGVQYEDALLCLTEIDRQIRVLEKAAAAAPRRYQFVVLSDHGQSQGATFRQRYGITLERLVWDLIGGVATVRQPQEAGEGAAYVSAALNQMVSAGGVAARAARRVGSAGPNDAVEIGENHEDREATAAADVVVCASGNLGLISFTNHPGRLSLESINHAHPGLIDGLVAHEGIGWLLVKSERHGALVLGKGGVRNLTSGAVDGADPLAAFPAGTVRYLARLTEYPNVPDIVVNSTLYDSATGEVAAFEELIGCHGGAGGWQTQPFIMFPADWTDHPPVIEGAEQVHDFLCRYLYPEPSQAASSRSGSAPAPASAAGTSLP